MLSTSCPSLQSLALFLAYLDIKMVSGPASGDLLAYSTMSRKNGPRTNYMEDLARRKRLTAILPMDTHLHLPLLKSRPPLHQVHLPAAVGPLRNHTKSLGLCCRGENLLTSKNPRIRTRDLEHSAFELFFSLSLVSDHLAPRDR